MNRYQKIIAACAVAAALMAAQRGAAQTTNTNVLTSTSSNLYPATVTAMCIMTNTNGTIVYTQFGNSNLIAECAADAGLTNTNLSSLMLVYNRSNSSLEVVTRSNQTVVCTPLTFSGGVSITNTNNTKVEFQRFVFSETNNTASGVLSGTETLTWGQSNQLTSFSLRGLLDYAEAADGTNGAAIYRGVLTVGSAAGNTGGGGTGTGGDEDDNDDDHGGGEHGGGHHGEGNHGNGKGNTGTPPGLANREHGRH
jgi:hypothetical protein